MRILGMCYQRCFPGRANHLTGRDKADGNAGLV